MIHTAVRVFVTFAAVLFCLDSKIMRIFAPKKDSTITMARKNIGAKPYMMPMPVLMLSAYVLENEKPCAMLAVWGGISKVEKTELVN